MISAFVIIVGLQTIFRGLLNGIIRKEIRNRFRQKMPYVTPPLA